MRKRSKFTAILCAAVMTLSLTSALPTQPITADAASTLLAFPGAVGAGKYATGGRGGEVYHVTNLNDSGTGSFRDAVSKSNRIVVFDVSGTIELESNILCQSNITIAGQTAPGGSGITLKNYKMGMSGDNIICRYISSRPGPYASTSSGNDAWGGAAGSNSIIDHCSMGWTTDEQWGLYSNNMNYTVQYSVIGPADSWGGHAKGLHGFGLMMGKGNLSFDHNLIIHNVSRNFRGKVQGTYTADFTNNIIYDWGYQTAYGTIGHLNYVGNTLKAGNSTTGGYHWMYVDSGTSPENFKVYCDGNQLINKDGSLHAITNDNWSGVTVKTSIGITKDDLYSETYFQTMQNGIDVSSVNDVEPTADAYEHVISYAGNGISPDQRTAIDQQCAEETRTGTGSCSGTAAYDSTKTDLDKYNIQCDVTYEYPAAVTEKTIVDNDNDGMDDNWELARGLDPTDPTDYKGDYCGQGYMNIEYYINDLTVNSFPEGVVTPSPEVETTYISAFDQIEAENYSDQSGVRTENCTEGGQNVGYIENGDYLLFRNIDFEDGAKSFTARIAGGTAGIELYLNSLDGTPAATLTVSNTGNWQTWESVTWNIPAISGKHNLYLKFTGGEGYLFNINYFTFGRETVPLNGTLIQNLLVNDGENAGDWSIAADTAQGGLLYGDRDFTSATLPEVLMGAEAIRTACDSKNYTDTLGVFTAGKDITVYVALDTRVETLPDWLSDWNRTGLIFQSSNDVTFALYAKTYNVGDTVTLGSNGQSSNCVGYLVYAKEAGIPETTVAVTAEYTTETIVTTTSLEMPVMIRGDVNGDNAFSAADLVLMQRYLLGLAPLTQWQMGDLIEDGMINGFDLARIRLELLAL